MCFSASAQANVVGRDHSLEPTSRSGLLQKRYQLALACREEQISNLHVSVKNLQVRFCLSTTGVRARSEAKHWESSHL